jgi:hypothetical protein
MNGGPIGKGLQTAKSQETTGRTWADLIVKLEIPVWLTAISLFVIVVILAFASFVFERKISLGFLGDFGPTASGSASPVFSDVEVSRLKELTSRFTEFSSTAFCFVQPGVQTIKTCVHSNGDIASYSMPYTVGDRPLFSMAPRSKWKHVCDVTTALTHSLQITLPAQITSLGERAACRFLEFFTSRIRNPHTRRFYVKAVGDFCSWIEAQGIA